MSHTSGELRLLHWNVHSWRDATGSTNIEAVVELLRDTDPDVAALVEVDEPWVGPSALDEVVRRYGYSSVFVPSFEFGRDDPAGGFGNALLSRRPILAVRQRQLVWPPRRYDGTEPSEPRSVTFVRVGTPTESIWIDSTHLPRSEPDVRASALERLITTAQNLPGPWLLLGDFNQPADSWLMDHPSLQACPTPAMPTYPADALTEPIDYCVAPSSLTVQAEVVPATGSDHLPILVRLTGQATDSS